MSRKRNVFSGRARIAALLLLSGSISAAAQTPTQTQTERRFGFGGQSREPGYSAIDADTAYTAERGYGWVDPDGAKDLEARDRKAPDALRRGFLFGHDPHTLRIDAPPGAYRLTVITGDLNFGDHALEIVPGDGTTAVGGVAGGPAPLPVLKTAAGEFATLQATLNVTRTPLNLTFRSPNNNWVINALTLTPVSSASDAAPPQVTRQRFAAARPEGASTWGPIASWPDPTVAYLTRFRARLNSPAPASFRPTGLSRSDYLKLIASEVDFWKRHQNADGAIIDPYRKQEWQYSTPAFAHAAAALVVYGGRKDLLEPAAKALDWAALTLSERRAASHHEDFFAPMLAHAIPLLEPLVAPERAARWKAEIRGFDPFATYRAAPGANNWNVVALSGEAMFQKEKIRPATSTFVRASLAAQGKHFGSPYGLYLEGPMAYDHFPRLWAGDMIAHGYNGPYHAELAETLRRASITSLFMQSPWGELPAGGRSAHHQWNEAEQCVTYEIYAARALRNGDPGLAAVFKRAAHLSLSSMRRWVRPSGEMQIVKNWVDPSRSHAFETYSAHSQYNLLPMAMLAIAYEHAATTEKIAEKPAPADLGGYVLSIEPLHKVFANVGGTYIEIDTNADHHYDATGLIRIHAKGVSPQIGPSDSVLQHPAYDRPSGSPETLNTGVGVSWQGPDGAWHRLGELDKAHSASGGVLSDVVSRPDRVSFRVRYAGDLWGASAVEESYTITQGRVALSTTVSGYHGPLRYVWPVLADDGRTKSAITVRGGTVRVTQDGGKTAQTFTPVGASNVRVEPDLYPNHNGWARLAVAEYPAGVGAITLVIRPK